MQLFADMAREKRQLIWLYIITLPTLICFFLTNSINWCPDTPGYFEAWDNLKSGQIDVVRTPLCPVLWGVVSDLVPEAHVSKVIVLFREVIFLVTVFFFYKSMLMIFGKPCRRTFWFSLFYAVFPAFLTYHSLMLTEALAIFLTVFMLYAMLTLYYKGATTKRCALYGTILFLMFMLRPAFLYIIPGILLFAYALYKRGNGKYLTQIFAATFLPIILLVGYCFIVKAECGKFTPSIIGTQNQFCTLRYERAFSPEDMPNEETAHLLTESYRLEDEHIETDRSALMWDFSKKVRQKFGREAIAEAVDNYIHRSPGGYIRMLLEHTLTFSNSSVIHRTFTPPNPLGFVALLFDVTFTALYLPLIVCLIVIILYYHRMHHLPYLASTLYLLVITHMASLIVGSPDDFSRLFAPGLIVLLTLFAIATKYISINLPFTNKR